MISNDFYFNCLLLPFQKIIINIFYYYFLKVKFYVQLSKYKNKNIGGEFALLNLNLFF